MKKYDKLIFVSGSDTSTSPMAEAILQSRYLLEDIIIESKQAIEMCNIYSSILSGTMDAFASIISNNLNIVMKLLAAVTIILTVPTIVFGLWGTNVPVPFEHSPFGFVIVLGLGLLATLAAVLLAKGRKWL